MTTEPDQPKRRGRPPKQVVFTNPACINPACLVTCHPECPNLRDNVEYEEWRKAERQREIGNDPTIRLT